MYIRVVLQLWNDVTDHIYVTKSKVPDQTPPLRERGGV